MKILGNRVLVSKIEEPKTDGFQTVEVQDSFVYKGKVEQIATKSHHIPGCGDFGEVNGETTEFKGKIGDTILFVKYSPDTQEVTHEGQTMKIINVDDILAVL